MKKKVGILAAVIVALALSGPVFAGKADNSLNIALKLENYNMDSYFTTHRIGIIITRHIWDSLLYRDPSDFSYKPALATSYKWIDDTTLEFKLRKGVKFHHVNDIKDVIEIALLNEKVENPVKIGIPKKK